MSNRVSSMSTRTSDRMTAAYPRTTPFAQAHAFRPRAVMYAWARHVLPTRIGLEATAVPPSGELALDNACLVRAALEIPTG